MIIQLSWRGVHLRSSNFNE